MGDRAQWQPVDMTVKPLYYTATGLVYHVSGSLTPEHETARIEHRAKDRMMNIGAAKRIMYRMPASLAERREYFAALKSYEEYIKREKVRNYNRRRNFHALPMEHYDLLCRPPISYTDTLALIEECTASNAVLARNIEIFGRLQISKFAPSLDTLDDYALRNWVGQSEISEDVLSASARVISNCYRDWSAEGASERAVYRDRVLSVLEALKEEGVNKEVRLRTLNVLVPGSGLGRFLYELSMCRINAHGNEKCWLSSIATAYMLGSKLETNKFTIYPWLEKTSNHRSRLSGQLRPIKIPDVPAQTELDRSYSSQITLRTSDFLDYQDPVFKGAYDAVASIFFLDTSPNVIKYLEIMSHCLKPGGRLINFGPLSWHYEGVSPEKVPPRYQGQGIIELTNDEILQVVRKLGFEIIKSEHGIASGYNTHPESMKSHGFNCSFWVAKKIDPTVAQEKEAEQREADLDADLDDDSIVPEPQVEPWTR